MKSRNFALSVSALISVLSAPLIAQSENEWKPINDPAELRALYSNKTFKGTFTGNGVTWVGHYNADGRGLLTLNDKTTPRTWKVKGKDQVCATDVNGTTCNVFWRHRDKKGLIKIMNVDKGWASEAVVEDGIPKF